MDPVLDRLRAELAGRYEVEQELGRGGVAVVYLAKDVRHERRVAIKVLRTDLGSSGTERFLREIRTVAQLHHPHILGLHDSGNVDGHLFYVMPYVEGETLREKLEREGQFSVDEAVRVAREVATFTALVLGVLLATACGSEDPTSPESPDNASADTIRIPLTDLGTGTYKGFVGGLYPNGSNTLPVTHGQRGVLVARSVQPLDPLGRPSAGGKYVLLSIGMSNVSQEWCAEAGTVCNAWSFSGKAAVDPAVNHTTLVIANGARGGQTADLWDAPDESNYERVRTQVLEPAGLTEAQVQIVWLGAVRRQPTVSLPNADADAYILLGWLGDVARTLKTRYPNLRQIFVSSRTYAGFATTALNPEPYAYETGFAFKWLVEAQIKQVESGVIDPRAGDLGPSRTAWMAWGPYFWAGDAARPRSDGLFWMPADFEADGTHESTLGEEKAGRMLLEFFKTAPHARCWFLARQAC